MYADEAKEKAWLLKLLENSRGKGSDEEPTEQVKPDRCPAE